MSNTVRSADGQVLYRVSEYRYWSPTHGCDISRVSMFNAAGHEFWMELPCEDGRAYRAALRDAAESIDQAIREGLEPGEVRVLA